MNWAEVFDKLDRWKQLPNYQLERRADIFFAQYMAEALEIKLGSKVKPTIVPEFPAKQEDTKRSDKIDYLAVTADGNELVLIEIKTDMGSTRAAQWKYLRRAAKAKASGLLSWLVEIRKATNEGDKYDALFAELRGLGLDPEKPLDLPQECCVVVVQPNPTLDPQEAKKFRDEGIKVHVISLSAFETVVAMHPDPLSQRFAQSLREW